MADVNLLEGLDDLQLLPIAALQVAGMLATDEPDLVAISELIRIDEALAMAVLRLANSAMHGVPGREFNLREATIRLGSKELSKLVLKQQVGSAFDVAIDAFELNRGALWRSAIGGAFAAENLARAHLPGSEELCFVCALLRDVGKLGLNTRLGAEYERLVRQHLNDAKPYIAAEKDAFGMNHAEVGAMLAKNWGLPDQIVGAIASHHEPPAPGSAEHNPVFDIVHAADIVALWGGLAIGSDGLQYTLAPHVRTWLKLTRKDAESEIIKMWDKLNDAEHSLASAQHGGRIA